MSRRPPAHHISITRWMPRNDPKWTEYGARMNGGLSVRYKGSTLSIHRSLHTRAWIGVIDQEPIVNFLLDFPVRGSELAQRARLAHFLQEIIDERKHDDVHQGV